MGFALVSQIAAMQIAALVEVQGFVSRSVLSGGQVGVAGTAPCPGASCQGVLRYRRIAATVFSYERPFA